MDLCKQELCTGCLACFNICPKEAIKLEQDKEGFVYPQIDQSLCINCGQCQSVCPIINFKSKKNTPIKAYAAWQKDRHILFNSSSGGAFSAIAANVLNNNGYVFGAAFDSNWRVFHKGINNLNDLKQLQGSKYTQSDIGFAFKEIYQLLSKEIKVLFVGTPCQVSGLKSFLNNKKVNLQNLLVIDIACHGVPSPLMFKEYINHLEQTYGSNLVYFTFRDKKWSWLRFNCKAIFRNGKVYLGKWEEDIFMRGFLRDLFLRKCCGKCQFASPNREGNITLSDYWNYQIQPKEKSNEDTGVSVVLINDDKGAKAFNAIKDSLVFFERTVENALKSSPPYSHPFSPSPKRNEFWSDYCSKGYDFLIKKYFYPENIDSHFQKRYKYGRFIHNRLLKIEKKLDFIKVFIWRKILKRN